MNVARPLNRITRRVSREACGSQLINEGGVAKFLSFEPCISKRPKASEGNDQVTKDADHLGSRILIPVANASSGDM